MTSKNRGGFQLSLNLLRGFGADGGHLSTEGLSVDGEVIQAPLHRHRVSLDFLRIGLGTVYQIRNNWQVRFNAPYDIKNQDASIETLDPTTHEERQAILRNQQIHHRDDAYRGFADFSLMISRQISGVLADDDRLAVSLGTSIPIGDTEKDPWELGNAGQEHLHIQFGTGTFNPLIESHYSKPLTSRCSLGAIARGTFPLYENSKTYRGSVELSGGAEVKYRKKTWLAFQAGYFGLFQSYAYWDGEQDKNSGLISSLATLGVSIVVADGILLRIDGLMPLQKRTLADNSEAFERTPTLSLTTACSF